MAEVNQEAGAPDPPVPRSTRRLFLLKPRAADASDLFRMYSDARFWHDDPLLRHESLMETKAWIASWLHAWRRDGLGPWVLRSEPGAGDVVGVGGCSLPTVGIAWNLSFSLRPDLWGQGYAQEVAAAGLQGARALRPELPITAVVAGANTRSHRAVERAGLQCVWRGPDRKVKDDAKAELLLYADRALNEEQIRSLTS